MIYAALVVGGPLDGQRLAAKHQFHKHGLLKDVSSMVSSDPVDMTDYVIADVIEYQFGPIYLDHNNELNLWTPVGQSRLETLRKLLEGYKP